MGEFPFVAPRVSGCHGYLDASDADGDAGTDLEELEADGAAGRVGELGEAQADTAQRTEQHVGHGCEP